MNTIYTIAKHARDERGFTHMLAADGKETDLSVLADRKARFPKPNGWAYVDRPCGVTITHYKQNGQCDGYYKLIKK